MVHFETLTREHLTDDNVLNAIDEHKVVIIVSNNWSNLLTTEIMPMIRMCSPFLSTRCNMKYVRLCVQSILEEDYDECEKCFRSPEKRCKFICHILGSMLEHGIFSCSANDLASKINMVSRARESCKRYINEGRSCGYVEIIRRLDKSIPKNPA